MNHYPTCQVWQSGHLPDCNCAGQKPWKIKKIGGQHPWQIFRRTGSLKNGWGIYEPFLCCTSYDAARELVISMIWLASVGMNSDV
jgi:hypothetical protein